MTLLPRNWAIVLLFLFLPATRAAMAQASAPLDVLLVLDQSRSMRESDPKRVVVQVVTQFMQQLRPEPSAGVVLFGGQAWTVQDLAPFADEHRRQVLASISDIRYADAQSNPVAAVDTALAELKSRGRPESLPVMVLLSDGGIDTGSKARDVEIQQLLESQILPEARQKKVRIYTVAFTAYADLKLLQKMALESGGESYLALDPDELRPVFGRISDAISGLVKTLPTKPQPPAETPKTSVSLDPSVPLSPTATPAGKSRSWLVFVFTGLIGLAALGSFLFLVLKSKRTTRPALPMPQASLVDLRNGKPFQLDKTIIQVGRNADNDLVISERTVSARHALIRYHEGKFYLQDLKSANTTQLNGKKVVGEVELRAGDVVRFDRFGYAFKGPDGAADPTLLQHRSL